MAENEKARAKRLMDNYKLSIEQWMAVDRYQRGKCAVCGRPCSTGRRLAVDHDHFTGLVRGLLCSKCNPLLGKLENAFVRYGMHKQFGVTLIDVVRGILAYLMAPPATSALGGEHYGYSGRIGTKKHRKTLKKLAGEAKAKR